jgi:GNAT superfamily N-acetyltransferase
MTYAIRALDGNAHTTGFDCGETRLDEYLQRYAAGHQAWGSPGIRGQPTGHEQSVAGFYTLSAASIAAETLPETWRKKLPRYPLPVALLGRLAVSRQFQGQGLGSILLADACKRISAASQTLGVAAIVVDAKSAQAATFYQHFGFLALPVSPAAGCCRDHIL